MKDLNLNKGTPIINRDIDLLKQQINILFETTPGDLHGDVNFGTAYEKALYELKYDSNEMSAMMMTDLGKMDLLGFTPSVTSYLLEGSEREICVIEVNLTRGYESYTNIYKIE